MVNKSRPLKATARYEDVRGMCGNAIAKGSRITTWGRSWVHLNCIDHEPTGNPSAHRPWLPYLKAKDVEGAPDPSRIAGDDSAHFVVEGLDDNVPEATTKAPPHEPSRPSTERSRGSLTRENGL